jgi:hypothetical protein
MGILSWEFFHDFDRRALARSASARFFLNSSLSVGVASRMLGFPQSGQESTCPVRSKIKRHLSQV